MCKVKVKFKSSVDTHTGPSIVEFVFADNIDHVNEDFFFHELNVTSSGFVCERIFAHDKVGDCDLVLEKPLVKWWRNSPRFIEPECLKALGVK